MAEAMSLLVEKQRVMAAASTQGAVGASVASPSIGPNPFDLWDVVSTKLQEHGQSGLILLVILVVTGYILSQAQNIEALLRLTGRNRKPTRPDLPIRKESPGNQVDILFVNSMGENVFRKLEGLGDSEDLARFTIRVHLKLSLPAPFCIVNLQLYYPRVKAFPGPQKARINGTDHIFDASYNLAHHTEEGPVSDIILWREFLCDSWAASNGDYNEVEVIVDFVASGSTGYKKLIISGFLAPGGEVISVTKDITEFLQ